MPRTKKKQLIIAAPEVCFWVHNGPIIGTLREFRDALAHQITDEQYRYHATNNGNDFSAWIADVLGDKECAKKLRRIRRRATALDILDTCLKSYA